MGSFDLLDMLKCAVAEYDQSVGPAMVALRDMLLDPYQGKAAASIINMMIAYENWCPECGSTLEHRSYQEYHSEVGAFETIGYMKCPNCGWES